MQKELADKLGVNEKTVLRWEGGKNFPQYKQWMMLCDLFGKTLTWFFYEGTQEGTLVVNGKTLQMDPALLRSLKWRLHPEELPMNLPF